MMELSLWGWVLVMLLASAALVCYFAWKNAHTGQQWDPMSVVGQKGVAQETFSDSGKILVRGEIWQATVKHGIVEKGESVVVRAVLEGMVLEIERG